MEEEARPLEVGEELMAEPDPLARALDESRDVGDVSWRPSGVDGAEQRLRAS